MLSNELLKAVRRLEIVAKRTVNDHLAGQYHSVFKGQGMDFLDVRTYQPGDDIRVIDWNVSARLNELHVKQFVEERELTVFIMVDISGSQAFGTVNYRKREIASQLAALIAFSAVRNNDRAGLITFSSEVETTLPPKKGRKHVLRIITEVLGSEASHKGTNIRECLEYFMRITRKKTVAFLISDFMDQDYDKVLRIANKRHEIVPVVITDPMEQQLPNVGLINFEDPETGEIVTVDTSSAHIRKAYAKRIEAMSTQRDRLFNKLRIDSISIRTDQNHIEPVIQYFRRRAN